MKVDSCTVSEGSVRNRDINSTITISDDINQAMVEIRLLGGLTESCGVQFMGIER